MEYHKRLIKDIFINRVLKHQNELIPANEMIKNSKSKVIKAKAEKALIRFYGETIIYKTIQMLNDDEISKETKDKGRELLKAVPDDVLANAKKIYEERKIYDEKIEKSIPSAINLYENFKKMTFSEWEQLPNISPLDVFIFSKMIVLDVLDLLNEENKKELSDRNKSARKARPKQPMEILKEKVKADYLDAFEPINENVLRFKYSKKIDFLNAMNKKYNNAFLENTNFYKWLKQWEQEKGVLMRGNEAIIIKK